MPRPHVQSVDEYINYFPLEVQEKLETIRKTVQSLVPDAVETISYQIPTFKYKKKNLIHFAAFSDHVSIFPGAKAVEDFKDKLQDYQVSKGTVQFPLDKDLPIQLIIDITKHCLSLG